MCKMEGENKKANDGLHGTGQGILDERVDIEDKIKKVPIPLPNTSGYVGWTCSESFGFG